MILAITYGDENFSQSNKYNLYSAKRYGKSDQTLLFGPKDLDEEFKREHKKILEEKRGAGYWLWKPYSITKALQTIKYGDYLVYADSGSFYTCNLNIMIEFMKKKNIELFLGELEHKEAKYSKRDAFVYLGVDTEAIANSLQYEASFILLKKTPITEKLIKEWLEKCCDIRIISDNQNTCGKNNYSEFVENRYDQTVLSLLAKKYGITGYRPVDTLRSELYPDSDYGQIIVRTRYRNCGFIKFKCKILFKWLKYLRNNRKLGR